MCISTFGYEPYDPNNPDDIEAVDTKLALEYGFYADP